MLGVDGEGMAFPLNRCAQAAQNVVHDLDVGNMRNVVERAFALAQHGCGNKLQSGILSAADLNGARNVFGFARDDYFF